MRIFRRPFEGAFLYLMGVPFLKTIESLSESRHISMNFGISGFPIS